MAIEDNTPNLQSDLALLNSEEETPIEEIAEDKTPKRELPKKEVEDEIPEEEVIEDKIPEEEEEIQDEDRELLPHERPTMDQIKKKFPDFFKTFPTLQSAFNRERQFSEIFHTPQEARDASELALEFSDLREDIVNGTGEKLLPALKEADSLTKFSKSFLPNLFKTDKDLHWQTIVPIIEDSVRYAYSEGVRSKNEDLKNSALFVAQCLLGDMSIAEGKRTLVQREEPKDDKVNEERTRFENERYNAFNIDVHEAVYNALTTEIDKGFKEEDGLTKFMRNSIRKEILDQIVQTIKADKVHTKYLNRLWLEAKKSGFRSDDKTRIINASLARAKSLVPTLRRKLISEAIGSSPLESERKREKVETTNSRREPGSQGRPGTERLKTPSAKKIDWKKTSDMDFLNDKFELKRR